MGDLNKREVTRLLNYFYFQNVWNETKTEFSVNVRTQAIDKGRGYVGFCFLGNEVLPLPKPNMPFHIYRVNKEYIDGMDNVPYGQWIDATDLCNQYNVILHTYSHIGRMHSKSGVFIYLIKNSNIITIAIDRDLLKSFGDTNRDIYSTFYIDSTVNDRVTVHSNYYTRNNLDHLPNIHKEIEHELMCFVDGYSVHPSKVIGSQEHAVDIIIDRNIVGEFSVNITEQSNIYYSEKDMLYKELIHIPKELGFCNEVITYNSCDFFIRGTDNHTGTFIHTTSDKTIGQVTHNDFSIPRYIIDAHRDNISDEQVYVNVKLRTYEKDNKLFPNQYYWDILYSTQTDEEIIKHLMGEIDHIDLWFWKASTLEKSLLTKSLLRCKAITVDDVDSYIQELGYYNVLRLICDRIISYYANPDYNYQYFTKPWIWANDDIIPLVYINHRKISDKYINYENSIGYLSVIFEEIVHRTNEDLVDIIMLPKGNPDNYVFEPNEDNHIFHISNTKSFKLYERIELDASISGPYETHNIGWKEVDLDASNIVITNDPNNHRYILRFGLSNYGKVFISVYNTYSYVQEIDLEPYITEAKSFIIPLTKTDSTDTVSFPILNSNNLYIYLNNRYLIEGIDYKTKIIYNEDNVISHNLIIQNLSYCKDEGSNILEVYVSTLNTHNKDTGYVIDNELSRDKDVDITIRGLSIAHIDGYVETDIGGVDITVPLSSEYRNGAPFEISTDVPIEYTELIPSHIYEYDNDILTNIDNYLQKSETEVPQVIIEHSHVIMSSYFNYILYDIINDKVNVSYDPIVNNMLRQLRDYEYIKEYDLLFDDNHDIDLKYVDIRPNYSQLTIPDINKRNIIVRLFENIFPNDPNQSGVTVND